MRFFVLLIGLAAGCGAADLSPTAEPFAVIEHRLTATEDEQRDALTRLASSDPIEIAWGAYFAGELGVEAAIEPLLGHVNDTTFARDNVLDALARLGAHVPASALDHSTSATAVALQNPSEHRDYLFAAWLRARPTDSRWGGYANALASIRDHGFAGKLLESLTSTINIDVVSEGEMHGAFGCVCGSSSWCGGYRYAPADNPYPPEPVWAISDTDDADCIAFLPGPADVCLTRSETQRLGPDYGSLPDDTTEDSADTEEMDLDHNARLLDYIASLAGHDVSFEGDLTVEHAWVDAATLTTFARDMRDQVQTGYAALVNELDEAHLLDTAPADIRIAFEVWDNRSDATSPLPAVQ